MLLSISEKTKNLTNFSSIKPLIYCVEIEMLAKDTHREKAPSNKTRTVSKSMNMDIWVVGTSNQLLIQGS